MKITESVLEDLKEILRLSPSSINSQPWKFSFIVDETIKRKLASVSYFNEEKINEASHLVVFHVIDDVEAFEKQIHENLSQGSIDYYNYNVKPKSEDKIKEWLQNQVYLSLGFFLSACASMEIDSTPMEGINNNEYDKVLNIDGYKTVFSVAIGYRDVADKNQPSVNPKSRLALEKVILTR